MRQPEPPAARAGGQKRLGLRRAARAGTVCDMGWPHSFFGLACAALAGSLVGCGGEVEVERLIVRPSLEDYQRHIQPLLVSMQCSLPSCHGTTFVGEVRVTAEPDNEAIYRDYQALKAVVDLNDPEASVLTARLLVGAAGATHVPLCFKSTEDCSYRKLIAWIAWDGEGPGPGDLACDAEGETCFR